MRFIKTTYGIFKRDRFQTAYCKLSYGKNTVVSYGAMDRKNQLFTVDKKDVIKQADDLKDLCDKYLVIRKYVPEPITVSYYELECDGYMHNYIKKIKSNDPIVAIYGAVWIKGEHGEPILRSVAIMNDIGGLDLI